MHHDGEHPISNIRSTAFPSQVISKLRKGPCHKTSQTCTSRQKISQPWIESDMKKISHFIPQILFEIRMWKTCKNWQRDFIHLKWRRPGRDGLRGEAAEGPVNPGPSLPSQPLLVSEVRADRQDQRVRHLALQLTLRVFAVLMMKMMAASTLTLVLLFLYFKRRIASQPRNSR